MEMRGTSQLQCFGLVRLEMRGTSQWRWFGYVVKMEMRGTAKWPGKLEQRGRNPEEGPDGLGKRGYRTFWRQQ
jgi:hypothetical protein